MTQDEIIEMAEQAGMTQDGNMWFSNGKEDMDIEHKHLVAFAHLVAAKALAQQEQEPPVAFEYDEDNDPIGEVVGFIEGSNYIMVKVHDGKQVSLNDDLYDTPPQRTWVGLTRRERFEIEKAMSKYYDYQHECKTVCLPEFAAAIEAKLKEKNT